MNETKKHIKCHKIGENEKFKAVDKFIHTLIINLTINLTLKHLVFLFFIETYPSYSKAN